MLLRFTIVLIFILLQLNLVMDTLGDVLEQPQIGPPSLDSQPDSEVAGAWSFCALVRGEDWDPSVFTRVLNDSTATDKEKLFEETQILSYACRDRSKVVPHGFVPVEGYLKCKGSKHVRRGTLRRRLKHPDLTIEWTAIRIGREHRYTDHDWIQTFHRETALPPTGVLQPSAGAAGPLLRVDFREPSDAPINRGGRRDHNINMAAASGAGAIGPTALSPPATAAAAAAIDFVSIMQAALAAAS